MLVLVGTVQPDLPAPDEVPNKVSKSQRVSAAAFVKLTTPAAVTAPPASTLLSKTLLASKARKYFSPISM